MSETAKPPTPPGLQLQIDEDVAQGAYSNFQIVGASETEFFVDFAFIQPGTPRGKIRARMILSPKHAKSLVSMLAERVRDWEERFGPIPPPSFPAPPSGGLTN